MTRQYTLPIRYWHVRIPMTEELFAAIHAELNRRYSQDPRSKRKSGSISVLVADALEAYFDADANL